MLKRQRLKNNLDAKAAQQLFTKQQKEDNIYAKAALQFSKQQQKEDNALAKLAQISLQKQNILNKMTRSNKASLSVIQKQNYDIKWQRQKREQVALLTSPGKAAISVQKRTMKKVCTHQQ